MVLLSLVAIYGSWIPQILPLRTTTAVCNPAKYLHMKDKLATYKITNAIIRHTRGCPQLVHNPKLDDSITPK